MGLSGVVMPENYVAMFDVPDKEAADTVLKKATPMILDVAEHIKSGRPLPPQKVTLYDRIKSGIVNDVFYPFFVKAKGFYATDACIGCGRCASLCPMNNIALKERRPKWSESCTHCMACIAGCPALAIEYKKNSISKPRYFNTAEPPI
jgi:ferredoxin